VLGGKRLGSVGSIRGCVSSLATTTFVVMTLRAGSTVGGSALRLGVVSVRGYWRLERVGLRGGMRLRLVSEDGV